MSYLISFFVSAMADVTAYIVKRWIDKRNRSIIPRTAKEKSPGNGARKG